MRAVAQERYGGPEVLALVDVPEPEPGPDEVVVEVRAAAVNAADWHIMRGEPRLARLDLGTFGWRAPRARVRGSDFAGVVTAVGRRVTGLSVGDEVFGEGRGSFAERVVADAGAVAHKPGSVTWEQAATLPMAGTTALLLLRAGDTSRGSRVLVNGASGGVGTFAVQLASSWGAEVTAVCSARNADQARALGADDVVDYATTDFAASGRAWDVIVDLVGNRRLRHLRGSLAEHGTLVLSGGGVSGQGRYIGPIGLMGRGKLTAPFGRGRTAVSLARATTAGLTELATLTASGELRPVIQRTFPMPEASEAIRLLETEHAQGKVVLSGGL